MSVHISDLYIRDTTNVSNIVSYPTYNACVRQFKCESYMVGGKINIILFYSRFSLKVCFSSEENLIYTKTSTVFI
jgi:hypothetical protein